jgi:hypothetical protein
VTDPNPTTRTVRGGSFCSEPGATAQTSTGRAAECSLNPTKPADRLRWRATEPPKRQPSTRRRRAEPAAVQLPLPGEALAAAPMIVEQVSLNCDWCGRPHTGGYPGANGADRLLAARRDMAGQGWDITAAGDRCPDCRPVQADAAPAGSITDGYGRVWTRTPGSDDLYTHDGCLTHPADRIPDLGLPSPTLADNPGYAGLCPTCRSGWPRPGTRFAEIRTDLRDKALAIQAEAAERPKCGNCQAFLDAPSVRASTQMKGICTECAEQFGHPEPAATPHAARDAASAAGWEEGQVLNSSRGPVVYLSPDEHDASGRGGEGQLVRLPDGEEIMVSADMLRNHNPRDEQIEAAVRQAYFDVVSSDGPWGDGGMTGLVPVALVRAKLDQQYDRATVDRVLDRMIEQPGVSLQESLIPVDDAMQHGAVRIADQDRHLIRVDPSVATDWYGYQPCPDCGAYQNQPCWDMRYRERTVPASTPHPGRPLVPADDGQLGGDPMSQDIMAMLAAGDTADEAVAEVADEGGTQPIDRGVACAYVGEVVDLYNQRNGTNLPGPTAVRADDWAAGQGITLPDWATKAGDGKPAWLDPKQVRAGIERETATRIRAAYRRLSQESGLQWVGLADIRDALPDVPRETVDGALLQLMEEDASRQDYRIIPIANTKALRGRDREAALTIGGEPHHAVFFRTDPTA